MSTINKIASVLLAVGLTVATTGLRAQIVSFDFSSSTNTVSGWTNIAGDPHLHVQTKTTAGITLSTVSTSNWSPNSSNNCAVNGYGESSGTYFPSAVMSDSWIQYNGTDNDLALYNALLPQIELTGLNPDSTYTLRMSGSNVDFTGATQYTVAGSSVSGSQDLTTFDNTSQGVTFLNVAPDSTGMIKIYVNCVSGLTGTSFAWICGLQVYSGSTPVGAPQVTITIPATGTMYSEGSNVQIDATATETAGSITKVEFYADTTKIGQVNTAPYNFTWSDPDPGSYTITAKATDNSGTINTAVINIDIQSLNYFWSTTGNIKTGGDTSFIGTVDSNRLTIRTRDTERMTILPNGNIGIGTKTPTAQLHTTGSVRFAGLASDSTKTRVLLQDTSGNLYYTSTANLGGRWKYNNGVVYDSADAIAIGTSNPQGYKLAVNGTAIFTKVKVKTAGTWPDYVFMNGYTPPDLKQLELYLQTYHHLPGIASAADVQRDGIDVGDQQAGILKKVEELTLYLIDQNKALADQNKQLQRQNAQLQDLQKQIDNLKKLLNAKK